MEDPTARIAGDARKSLAQIAHPFDRNAVAHEIDGSVLYPLGPVKSPKSQFGFLPHQIFCLVTGPEIKHRIGHTESFDRPVSFQVIRGIQILRVFGIAYLHRGIGILSKGTICKSQCNGRIVQFSTDSPKGKGERSVGLDHFSDFTIAGHHHTGFFTKDPFDGRGSRPNHQILIVQQQLPVQGKLMVHPQVALQGNLGMNPVNGEIVKRNGTVDREVSSGWGLC